MSVYDKKPYDFDDLVEVELYKVFVRLAGEVGATYMSYTFDYQNKKRYSFRSEPTWAKYYGNEKINGQLIIEQCPLDIASRKKGNIALIWDDYISKEQPKIYREIMGMREDIGLHHGVTLNTYFDNHHDAIAIATDSPKDNLALRILLKNKQLLAKYLLSCRKIIIKHYLMGK